MKIFPNEAFGYMRITVERPQRLRWEVTEETIAAVGSAKPIAKLDPVVLERVREVLAAHLGTKAATEREMAKKIGADLPKLDLPGPVEKALYGGLAVRDEEAPVIVSRGGEPVPDPELRDNENVPLPAISLSYMPDPGDRLNRMEFLSAVNDYMKAEVLPYVPDAWVDTDKTKIGYEIPLTRHFYKYVPPRPLEEIDAELKDLEAQVQRLLAEVTA